MFCPKCKCEYSEGITTCPNCNTELVTSLHNDTQIHPVIIKSVNNEIDAQLTMNLLKQNHINCFRKSREAGEYMRIYMGFSVFGEDIYVDKKDYQAASDLLNNLANNQDYIDETNYDSIYKIPFYRNPRIIARIIIVITTIIPFLLYILSKMKC